MAAKAAFTIQPASYVDHITEDGEQLTKRPYPLHTDDKGNVLRRESSQGDPKRVPGFLKDPAVQQIDLPWYAFLEDPQAAVGMYVIYQDHKGDYGNLVTAVETVEVLD